MKWKKGGRRRKRMKKRWEEESIVNHCACHTHSNKDPFPIPELSHKTCLVAQDSSSHIFAKCKCVCLGKILQKQKYSLRIFSPKKHIVHYYKSIAHGIAHLDTHNRCAGGTQAWQGQAAARIVGPSGRRATWPSYGWSWRNEIDGFEKWLEHWDQFFAFRSFLQEEDNFPTTTALCGLAKDRILPAGCCVALDLPLLVIWQKSADRAHPGHQCHLKLPQKHHKLNKRLFWATKIWGGLLWSITCGNSWLIQRMRHDLQPWVFMRICPSLGLGHWGGWGMGCEDIIFRSKHFFLSDKKTPKCHRSKKITQVHTFLFIDIFSIYRHNSSVNKYKICWQHWEKEGTP